MTNNLHGASSKEVNAKGKVPHALNTELDVPPSACPQKMELVAVHENCSRNLGLSLPAPVIETSCRHGAGKNSYAQEEANHSTDPGFQQQLAATLHSRTWAETPVAVSHVD